MPEPSPKDRSWSTAIKLDELIALNDEILALARSGMPLERGMVSMGDDLPGKLRAISQAVGSRMRAGEPLGVALESANLGIPDVYKAVVEAGIRSGRLSAALEGMAAYARAVTEARRSIAMAIWYPLFLLVMSYSLFVLLVTLLMPKFVEAFESLGLPVHGVIQILATLGTSSQYWGPLFPIALVIGFVVWRISDRALTLGPGGRFAPIRFVPGVNSMLAGFEAAGFADLLAILVEHQVPMAEAMTLAGRASGDPRMRMAAESAAKVIEEGRPISEGRGVLAVFPPLLRWLLSTNPGQAELAEGLKQMAERYRGLARYKANKLKAILPTLLLFGVGASSALIYGLALFLPLAALWDSLANAAP